MSINIYVGNLPYDVTEDALTELFSKYGQVVKTVIIYDRDTGRSKGYGFAELEEREDGLKAIEDLAGNMFEGRYLTVNEARNRQQGVTDTRPRASGLAGTTGTTGSSGTSGPPKPQRSAAFVEPTNESRGYSNSVIGTDRVLKRAAEDTDDTDEVEESASGGGYSNSRSRA